MGVAADKSGPSGKDVDQLGPVGRIQGAFPFIPLRDSQN